MTGIFVLCTLMGVLTVSAMLMTFDVIDTLEAWLKLLERED